MRFCFAQWNFKSIVSGLRHLLSRVTQWQSSQIPPDNQTWRWRIPYSILSRDSYFPIETFNLKGFPIATFDYQRVYTINIQKAFPNFTRSSRGIPKLPTTAGTQIPNQAWTKARPGQCCKLRPYGIVLKRLIYVYVCIYVCLYVCRIEFVCVYTYTYMHIHICIYIYT